jgi:predicted  nucleic acid-binding Zn-ribbon protein
MEFEDKKKNHYLSKSLYIRGLRCHKSLYLHKFHPELRDEISDEQKTLLQTGFKVGNYARRLSPGGTEIPYEGLTHSEQVEKIKAEIDKGTEAILFGIIFAT